MRCADTIDSTKKSTGFSLIKMASATHVEQRQNLFLVMPKKIWEYPDGELRVTVYHSGFHSCVPIKKSRAPQTDASKAFSQSRTIKPERYANDKLIEAIETEQPPDEIEELADSLVDRSELSKIKKSVNENLTQKVTVTML